VFRSDRVWILYSISELDYTGNEQI